jgi:hypothetical protein
LKSIQPLNFLIMVLFQVPTHSTTQWECTKLGSIMLPQILQFSQPRLMRSSPNKL